MTENVGLGRNSDITRRVQYGRKQGVVSGTLIERRVAYHEVDDMIVKNLEMWHRYTRLDLSYSDLIAQIKNLPTVRQCKYKREEALAIVKNIPGLEEVAEEVCVVIAHAEDSGLIAA